MLEFGIRNEEEFVDAIETGKIVKVSEEYAKREGLLILRKQIKIPEKTSEQKKDDEVRTNKGFIGMEDLRKPLNSEKSELLSELIENFHWAIVQKRKAKGLSRKKVAEAIGEDELSVKMIENGVMPSDNFILINKLESLYGTTFRKNKPADSVQPLRQIIDFNKAQGSGGSSGARTPRWARRFKTREKKEESAQEPEIEIIGEETLDVKEEDKGPSQG